MLLYNSVSEFFADPQHQKDFEEWKKSREDKACTEENRGEEAKASGQ